MRTVRSSPALGRSALAAALLATGSVAQHWRLAESGGVGDFAGAIAYDLARHQLVCYGGRSDGTVVIDPGRTMVFDGSRWNVIASAPGRPWGNFRDGMTFDRVRGRLLRYDWVLRSLLEWDGAAWNVLPNAGPAPTRVFVFEHDPVRNRVVAADG